MNSLSDIRVEEMNTIINEYLTAISSIGDSFGDICGYLTNKNAKANQCLGDFIKKENINSEEDLLRKFAENPQNIKKWKVLNKNIQRSEHALKIFPESLFVSLVSQFDVLIAQLIKYIYKIAPKKLFESEATIPIRDLFIEDSVEIIKERYINGKVETVLRKSHLEQIKDISKMIDNTPLDKCSFWGEFIEITQRRNLFVHCKGVVSEQYINECQKASCTINTKVGDALSVDREYFSKAYFVLFCIGVMLSQVVVRKLLESTLIGEIDTILNNVIYESISEKKYNIAIELSNFALSKATCHCSRLDEVYFVLNYAQAYKWQGNKEKCDEILAEFDFSAMKDDILIAKYALEDDVTNVVRLMKKIGANSEIMCDEAYATWEIFKDMRNNVDFQRTYQDIFGKPLYEDSIKSKDDDLGKSLQAVLEEMAKVTTDLVKAQKKQNNYDK